MKKIVFSFLLVVAAAIGFTACNELEQTPSPEGYNVILRAGNPEANPSTKTVMDGVKVNWNAGDMIGVSNGTAKSNVGFTSTLTEPASFSKFASSTAVSGDLYAYYPFTTNGVSDEGLAKIDIPTIQNPSVSSFDGNADVLVSKEFTVDETTEIVDLEFTRATSVIKVVLQDTDNKLSGEVLKSLTFTTESVNITGRAYLSFNDQALTEIYYNQSKSAKAEYANADRFSIDGTNPVLLSVFPVTLSADSKLTISAVTDTKNIVKEITLPSSLSFSAGKITTLNISIRESNISNAAGLDLPISDYYSWNDQTSEDSNTDLSSTITEYTDDNGVSYFESASKLYAGKNGALKLGTGSSSGYFKTVPLNLSSAFDIHISTLKYSSDAGQVKVYVDEDCVKTITPDASLTLTTIECDAATSTSFIRVETTEKRAYIDQFIVVAHGESVPGPKPAILASNPSDVAATVTSVEVPYEIKNPVSGVSLTAEIASDASWITLATVSEDKIVFTINQQAADATNARSGNVTLKYAGANDKVITITQSAPSNIDILNIALTGVPNNGGYTAWDGKQSNTSAVYAGQSAGGNSSIQLRSTSPSGIVTTSSGGYAKKVTVTWQSNTSSGRKLDIYGKNSAYSSSSDLYGDDAGLLIGSIVYGTSTELTIPYDCQYIGLRSNSNALYITEISIEWSATASGTPLPSATYDVSIASSISNGTVTANKTTGIEAGESITLTISPEPNCKLETLTVDGTDVTSSVEDDEYSFTMPAHNVSVQAYFVSTLSNVSFTYADFVGQGVSGSGGAISSTKDGITVSSDNGFGDAAHVRVYSGGKITVSSTSTITRIELISTASGTSNNGPSKISTDNGNYSYSGNTGTWVGSANSVTFNATAQFRFTEIKVY